MASIQYSSNAKINLGLIIKGRTANGYHLLETLFYPVDLADELEMETAAGDDCAVEMIGIDEVIPAQSNLCYKAWRLMKDAFPAVGGLRVRVTKNIPAGGGLGGGSSNAAFVIRGVNELFALGLSDSEMATLAKPLGADVPFFIYNRPMLARGIGQDLEPYDLDLPFEIRLVTPPIHSATADAYKHLDLNQCDPNRSLADILALPVPEWKNRLPNDLEGPVFAMYPELARLKAKLYADGAVYAAMTGSGAVLFGLYDYA